MSEESISIEETNKIRIFLGLKPIPLPNESNSQPAQKTSDEITIDETNKLRASLGLKPIIPSQTPSTKSNEKDAEQYQEDIRKKERDERIRQKLEIAKSKAAKRKKVSIAKSLLDEDEDQDTDDWLNNIKKVDVIKPVKKKKIAKKNVDGNDGGIQGIKVGHSVDDINNLQQEDVILTLKDRSIHDEEDELESDLLVKKQKLEKQMAEKLRSNKYKQYDGLEGEEKTLLERYNEELQGGDGGDSFVLNGETIKVDNSKVDNMEDDGASGSKRNRMEFRLDDHDDDDGEDEEMENNDYAKAKPIKMKKLKKKSGKNSRKKEERVDEDGDVINLTTVELKDEDSSIQDDFEIQKVLALKRLKNQKKRKFLRPEDIAKEINEDKENEMNVDEDQSQGIVIDENTEFLGSIKAVADEEVNKKEDSKSDIDDLEESQTVGQPVNQDPILDSVEVEQQDVQESGEETSLDESNVNFNGGLGSLLGFLKSKNIVQEKTSQQLESERKSKELRKKLDLDKLKTEIEKRIYEENLREDSAFQSLSKKEREEILESELEQFKELQDPNLIASKLKDYKPDIKLKYIDEYGREMNTKEAYKQLSHQFHGKGPSKSKISKKLKKIEEEQKQQYKENSILGSSGINDEDDYGSSKDKVGVRLQ